MPIPETINLLVVDDQPPMREMIGNMLRSNGYKSLHIVSNGREAMRAIRTRPVDFVITDWTMPHMTGIELLKTIKSAVSSFNIPVLMISDEGSVEKVLYAVEEGVDGFIIKPFSENSLIRSVESIILRKANPSRIEQLTDEMRRLKLSGKYREALEIGNEILKDGEIPKVAFLTCECLYHVREYDKAVQIISDSSEERKMGNQENLLGKIYMNLGKQKEAIMYLKEAARRNPLNHDRKIDLIRAYFGIGQIEDGEKIIEGIMSSEPTDLVLVDIAQLYLDLNDAGKAGYYLDRTVNPINETVHVFNNYAIALRKAGKYEESAETYRKCVKIAPDSDVLFYNLAFLYCMTNNLPGAREALKNALKLNPQNEHAKNLLQKIEQDPKSLASLSQGARFM